MRNVLKKKKLVHERNTAECKRPPRGDKIHTQDKHFKAAQYIQM